MITSKTNNQLKNIRKLSESGKARKEQGLFIAEGERILTGIPEGMITCLYLAESRSRDPEVLKAAESAAKTEIVTDELFKTISGTVNPQGMLAVVRKPSYELADLLAEEGKQERQILVLLDDIRDPGNLGTILRTSEAAGVKGVILSPGCADLFNPKVVRSTMGSIFRVPFITADLTKAIGLIKESGYEVYGTSLESAVSYKSVSYGRKTALVLGNEANGICKEVLTQTTSNIMIPMKGGIESLNAAVSLAILLFHIA